MRESFLRLRLMILCYESCEPSCLITKLGDKPTCASIQQTDFIVARLNVTRYYRQCRQYKGRTKIILWTHKWHTHTSPLRAIYRWNVSPGIDQYQRFCPVKVFWPIHYFHSLIRKKLQAIALIMDIIHMEPVRFQVHPINENVDCESKWGINGHVEDKYHYQWHGKYISACFMVRDF